MGLKSTRRAEQADFFENIFYRVYIGAQLSGLFSCSVLRFGIFLSKLDIVTSSVQRLIRTHYREELTHAKSALNP